MADATIRIIIAQQDFLVGDIEGNAQKIIAQLTKARDAEGGDVVVFPELAICGYSPEDLLLRPGMLARVEAALLRIALAARGIDVIVGHPQPQGQALYNAASVLRDGQIIATYHKQHLPNAGVFDEKRYFSAGDAACFVHIKGVAFALTICEDIWQPEVMLQAQAAGAKAVIALNASPYSLHKARERHAQLQAQAKRGAMPIVYVNLVGGQDELVFDGGSFVVDAAGEVAVQAGFFTPCLLPVDLPVQPDNTLTVDKQAVLRLPSDEASLYQALQLGLRDYVNNNGFPGVLIGMSGGIDSALTAALAVDALGADRVIGVLMPSRYTRAISLTQARAQCALLGMSAHELSIEPAFQAMLDTVAAPFAGADADVTEENLQARVRGSLLMALSNKWGHMVLATGNKSELSVGYATLYGDMVGGFCALKDVYKTWVYRLAHYRNGLSEAIPMEVITRAPSAELAPDQVDQDSLPAYDTLDAILHLYIEEEQDAAHIAKQGHDLAVVQQVCRLVDRNEYKRRQAAPGVQIMARAFGRNRRYPMTSGY